MTRFSGFDWHSDEWRVLKQFLVSSKAEFINQLIKQQQDVICTTELTG